LPISEPLDDEINVQRARDAIQPDNVIPGQGQMARSAAFLEDKKQG
jgi:hypothetical protein